MNLAMSENFDFEKFKSAPRWVKIVASVCIAIIAALSALYTLSSCGPMTRVTTRTSDSAAVNISINAPSENNITTDVDAQPSVTVEKTGKNTYTYTLNQK